MAMEEKSREQQRAKGVREDYIRGVEEVRNWTDRSGLLVQDRSAEPQQLKQQLQVMCGYRVQFDRGLWGTCGNIKFFFQDLQSEIKGVFEKLDKVDKKGQIIIEFTNDESEKGEILATYETLCSQVKELKTWIDQTKDRIADSLEAWKRCMNLYDIVMAWVSEKRVFLMEPLELGSLTEARQKLNDYSVSNSVRGVEIRSSVVLENSFNSFF